ncbi:MAG: DUF4870 domain-containing protein [Chitinophagaceae bacterium]|jgi:uncharacterized Tic20 family protein
MDQQQNYWQGGFKPEESAPYQPTSDERTMAILAHVLTIFFWVFAPLVIYLIKKDESKWVAEQAKESMNFQITWSIIIFAMVISIIGLLLVWIVAPIMLVLVIVATVKASENKLYRYPLTWRLIK